MMEASLREQLLRIYAETRTIAVVGASADESKAAHQVPRYLQSQGYRIVPVNLFIAHELLGLGPGPDAPID